MKKIITVFLALILVLCLTIPAHAVTPELDVPDMPEIPDIEDSIDWGFDIGSIIGAWFEENPVLPLTPTEPTEPVEEPTAPVGGGWFDWLRFWNWWD